MWSLNCLLNTALHDNILDILVVGAVSFGQRRSFTPLSGGDYRDLQLVEVLRINVYCMANHKYDIGVISS